MSPATTGLGLSHDPGCDPAKKRKPWAKAPKYAGQATFNLDENMEQIPFARKRGKSSHSPQARASEARGHCVICGTPGSRCECASDPLLVELNRLEEEAKLEDPPLGKKVLGSKLWPMWQTCDLTCAVATVFSSPQRVTLEQTLHNIQSPLYSSLLQKLESDPEGTPRMRHGHLQSVKQAKSIYLSLVRLEKLCKELQPRTRATGERGAFSRCKISLHRLLINLYCAFYLACRRSSAAQEIQALAVAHEMPERMWKQGIEPILEMAEDQPELLGSVLNFINHAHERLLHLQNEVENIDTEWLQVGEALVAYHRRVLDRMNKNEACKQVDQPHIPSEFIARSVPVRAYSTYHEADDLGLRLESSDRDRLAMGEEADDRDISIWAGFGQMLHNQDNDMSPRISNPQSSNWTWEDVGNIAMSWWLKIGSTITSSQAVFEGVFEHLFRTKLNIFSRWW